MRRALSIFVCAAVLRGHAALAQDTSAAQVWFDRGLALADQSRWLDAIEAFERARSIAPLPAVLYNLAEARRRANRAREALDAYLEYLERASASAQYRSLAMQRVAELERRVARLRLDVAPSDATVRVDDRAVAADEQVTLDPGPHAIAVTARGYEPEARTMTLQDGERATLVVHLARSVPEVHVEAPDAGVAAVVDAAPPPPPPPPTRPTEETTYRNAFQLTGVTHAILDEDSIGVGFGVRVGMRLGRSWEIALGLNREYTNGVGYVVGGAGFYYLAHAISPIAIYMGAVVAALIPQCSPSCRYTSSGTEAQSDMAVQVTVGARFEIFRWFGPFLEINGGIARPSDPVPLIYFGSGVVFSLPM